MNILEHKQSFGSVAKEYQKYRRYYDPKLYKLLSSLIKQSDPKILDLGSGTGKSTIPLLKIKNNAEVIGCEPDPLMLNEANIFARKFKLPVTYKKGSAERLPFKEMEFDVVTSGTAFHWFATNKALKEIKRVLKPKGLLFIFWTMDKKSDKPTIGVNLYKKYGWKAVPSKLRDLGFIEELFKKNGIAKVKTLKIPYIGKYTLQEYVGGLKTGSGYALMKPRQKIGFVKEMSAAFKKEVKGKAYRVNREICVCYGLTP